MEHQHTHYYVWGKCSEEELSYASECVPLICRGL